MIFEIVLDSLLGMPGAFAFIRIGPNTLYKSAMFKTRNEMQIHKRERETQYELYRFDI